MDNDLKKIEHLKTLVMSAVQLNDIMLSHAIKDTVADVNGTVDVILMDNKAERVARWLTPLDYITIQLAKLKEHVGTLENSFLSPQSLRVGRTVLWSPILCGVLVVLLDYEETFIQKKTLVLNIFCDYQCECVNAQTVENILHSLLKQRVQAHGLSDLIAFLYDNNTPLFLDNLTKILAQELKSFTVSTLSLMPWKNFWKMIETDTWLDIQATDEDIKMYIKTKLSSGHLAHHIKGRGDLHEEILSGVTMKADGMFLLAGMHIDSLAEISNQKSLRDTLTKLPGNIWEVYDNMLERVNSQSEDCQELAHHVFGWIAFARHPLTVLELWYALAMEPGMTTLDLNNLHDEDFLGDVCAGLVIKDETHSEWEDFQLSGATMKFMYVDNADNDNVLCTLAEKHPFLHYSSVHWGHHASGPVEHSIEDEIIAFLTDGADSANCKKVTNIFHKRTISNEVPVPIQFAMDYGLLHIMDILLLHEKYPCKELLLLTAVQQEDLEIVELLLDQDNVDPNAQSPSSKQTPLLYAVEEQDHTCIVEMLLQSGWVDVNSKGRNEWTPLMMAVSHGIIPTVEALLKHLGIDVLVRDNDGKAAYTHACHSGPDSGGMIMLFKKYGCSAKLDNYQPIYLMPVNSLYSQ
ncbi:uncharacterized protein EV420DRAFT_1735703 [Desarmillaria tabescens]|uniref:Ankyrin n=1 Tax=Armillaria tabescens TaxID=1929756 RepID=A0AA39MMC7_ARMTA|nr:uncharacterized protein EV420DRAFT_1735703 [Desarmillaria tabescens]KAK0439024.1 hypothetical protein EV420DRAFT_1735703 [Desarmillaria tabescens]